MTVICCQLHNVTYFLNIVLSYPSIARLCMKQYYLSTLSIVPSSSVSSPTVTPLLLFFIHRRTCTYTQIGAAEPTLRSKIGFYLQLLSSSFSSSTHYINQVGAGKPSIIAPVLHHLYIRLLEYLLLTVRSVHQSISTCRIPTPALKRSNGQRNEHRPLYPDAHISHERWDSVLRYYG